jgi:hypothetical protein
LADISSVVPRQNSIRQNACCIFFKLALCAAKLQAGAVRKS